MAPLEPWEKVLVLQDKFQEDPHNQMKCDYCHAGVQAPEKENAHQGLITDPSSGDYQICGNCHNVENNAFETSLHASLDGYWTAIDARSTPENHLQLETMFGNHCASCHTTCGDCHISQPNSVGGGFIEGHVVKKTPSMTRNCTACHGSRVGAEYLGQHEGIPGDVHFRSGRMNCVSCHAGMDMHNSNDACTACHTEPDDPALTTSVSRRTGVQVPSCESCHEQIGTSEDANPQHMMHKDKLSCQVCHSVSYSSCDGCHVAISDKTGNPFFETQGTYLGFFIGKNPDPNYHRPYEYVPVRHIPVDPESYAFYGENLLPNFDTRPTWVYTTPHNIQRITPQNESCANCHGNPDIFLTLDKVNLEEVNANLNVIIEEIPVLK